MLRRIHIKLYSDVFVRKTSFLYNESVVMIATRKKNVLASGCKPPE
jgi:hypothetical protein